MRITISEFNNTVGHSKEKSNCKAMLAYLTACLAEFGVQPTATEIDVESKYLAIKMMPSEKKLFLSSEENIIKLSPGDKRIKDDGRDFLKSRFLTKKQFTLLKRTLLTSFKSIGVDCVIRLHENDDDLPSSILLVDTYKKINHIEKLSLIQKTFPQERVK